MLTTHIPASKRPKDIFRHYLEDIIYGASDGIVTTFTVISGVEGAKLTVFVVIILGFVNLFADGVSMGASRFLSIRAGAFAHNQSRGVVEPLYHALCTFASFFIFGLLPLLCFLIPGMRVHSFLVSSIVTALSLFTVGAFRVFISKKHWFQGGMEMLVIGGVVSVIAYSVGYFLKSLAA